MAKRCSQSIKTVKDWFATLSEVQKIVKRDINSDASNDLKEFSKQKLGDLLKDEADKQEVNSGIYARFKTRVPNDAYADMKKTLLWFVDTIRLEQLRTLLHELYYYCGAQKLNPTVFTSNLMPRSFPDKTLTEVYGEAAGGNQPAGSNPQSVLDVAVRAAVHDSFCPDGLAYLDATNKVRKSVSVIID